MVLIELFLVIFEVSFCASAFLVLSPNASAVLSDIFLEI